MQPQPNNEKRMVDKRGLPKANPKAIVSGMYGTPSKTPKVSIDDKVLRNMPITQGDLRRIKKMYGI